MTGRYGRHRVQALNYFRNIKAFLAFGNHTLAVQDEGTDSMIRFVLVVVW